MRIAQHLEQIAVWVTWAPEVQVGKDWRQTKGEPPDRRQRRGSCSPQGCGLTSVLSGGSSVSVELVRSLVTQGGGVRRAWDDMASHHYGLECMDHAEPHAPDISDSTSDSG